MKKSLFLLVLCLTLSGCAYLSIMGDREPDTKVRTFIIDKQFSEVWNAIVLMMMETGIPIKSIEKDSGLITSDVVDIEDTWKISDYIDDGKGIITTWDYTWEKAKYYFMIIAKPFEQDKTEMSIKISFEAFDSNKTKQWHKLGSKGELEKEIYNAVVGKLTRKNLESGN